MTDDLEALPVLLTVTDAFNSRLPSQRLIDLVTKAEGVEFGDLAKTQPFRLIAFRALLRDYPLRDPTSLWLHAYDCEVEVVGLDPTNGISPERGHLSAVTGG